MILDKTDLRLFVHRSTSLILCFQLQLWIFLIFQLTRSHRLLDLLSNVTDSESTARWEITGKGFRFSSLLVSEMLLFKQPQISTWEKWVKKKKNSQILSEISRDDDKKMFQGTLMIWGGRTLYIFFVHKHFIMGFFFQSDTIFNYTRIYKAVERHMFCTNIERKAITEIK